MDDEVKAPCRHGVEADVFLPGVSIRFREYTKSLDDRRCTGAECFAFFDNIRRDLVDYSGEILPFNHSPFISSYCYRGERA